MHAIVEWQLPPLKFLDITSAIGKELKRTPRARITYPSATWADENGGAVGLNGVRGL